MAAFALDTQRSEYRFIFFMGLSVGLPTGVLFNFFPSIVGERLNLAGLGVNSNLLVAGILLVSALMSWPASKMVIRYGLVESFWVSLATTLVSMVTLLLVTNASIIVILCIIFAIAFVALSVSALPLSINRANYYEKVLCVGIFFSGSALPDAIMDVMGVW
jgi:hypothetical protein